MSPELLDDYADDLAGNGFAGQGWDGLNVDPRKLQKHMEQMAREELDQAKQVAAWFDKSPEGRAALRWIMRQTVHRSRTDTEISPASLELYAIEKAKREGQNSIAEMIIMAILTARMEKKGTK